MDGQRVTRLGKYEILEEIGRGGFATVYKALDPGLQRQVALKILHPHLAGDPPFVQRFLREARAAASLNHPHIVTIHEVGEEQGDYYIAMQYLPGPSLVDIIADEAPVGVERAVELLAPVVQALDYAHGRGFIHRDVKPSNVILDEERRPVLTDFGLVRAEEDASSATLSLTGMTLGTPQYMAPEQADPDYEGQLDGRCDIYALGVVAYELLTGQQPFQGKTPVKVLMAQVSKPPPKPREVNPSLPEAVESVLLKALAKTPEDRYQSGGDFVEALRQAGSEAKAERSELAEWVSYLKEILPPSHIQSDLQMLQKLYDFAAEELDLYSEERVEWAESHMRSLSESDFQYFRKLYDFAAEELGLYGEERVEWAESHMGSLSEQYVEQFQALFKFASTEIGLDPDEAVGWAMRKLSIY